LYRHRVIIKCLVIGSLKSGEIFLPYPRKGSRTFPACNAPALGMERSEDAQAAFPASQEVITEALQMCLGRSNDISS